MLTSFFWDYICVWRYPNLKNVKDLIYKKGLAKIDKQRVPLTDNNIIEQVSEDSHWIALRDLVLVVAKFHMV